MAEIEFREIHPRRATKDILTQADQLKPKEFGIATDTKEILFRLSTGELVIYPNGEAIAQAIADAISALPPAGEANSATNIGTGYEIFESKNGLNIQLRTLKAGTNIGITQGSEEIVITALAPITVAAMASTILLTGCLVTINADPTKVDIASGKIGVVSSSFPFAESEKDVSEVVGGTWIKSGFGTFISLDSNGDPLYSPTVANFGDKKNEVSLVFAIHLDGSIVTDIVPVYGDGARIYELITDFFRFVTALKDGFKGVGDAADLTFNLTAGNIMSPGNNYGVPGESSHVVERELYENVAFVQLPSFGSAAETTLIDPTQWESPVGTLTSTSAPKYYTQLLFVDPAGARYALHYSQVEHISEDAAKGELNETLSSLETHPILKSGKGAVCLGAFIMKGDITLGAQAIFVLTNAFGQFGGSGGGTSSGAVDSVFGRIGAIVATLNDYKASLLDNDSSVSGTTIKDALETLASAASGGGIGFAKTFNVLNMLEGGETGTNGVYNALYIGGANTATGVIIARTGNDFTSASRIGVAIYDGNGNRVAKMHANPFDWLEANGYIEDLGHGFMKILFDAPSVIAEGFYFASVYFDDTDTSRTIGRKPVFKNTNQPANSVAFNSGMVYGDPGNGVSGSYTWPVSVTLGGSSSSDKAYYLNITDD